MTNNQKPNPAGMTGNVSEDDFDIIIEKVGVDKFDPENSTLYDWSVIQYPPEGGVGEVVAGGKEAELTRKEALRKAKKAIKNIMNGVE